MSRGAALAAAVVAIVVAFIGAATAAHYGFFRNELYFIICGRHPAFGYVDQPPLVPLIAALTQSGGIHLWLLRLPCILAAVLLVPLTVAFAQLLGASTRGAWIAAVAAAFAPLLMAMTATLGTSTFEPLAFTAIAYCVTRAIVRSEPRQYLWAGLITGLTFEARYGVVFWLVGLAVGFLLAGPRNVFRSRDLWIGVAIAALVALPNVVWQVAHGLPFLALVRNDNPGNLIGTPLFFTVNQILTINIVLAPLWITGIISPFVSARLREYRFAAIAFLVTLILVYVTHGKMYYTIGAYPTMFALGAAACTGLPRWLVAFWAVFAVANGAFALPFVVPVYRPGTLMRVMQRSAFRPPPVEIAGEGAPLMEVFSDEIGWPALARTVERVYAALPPNDRARAAIYADNYGDASAIAFFGKGLPPVISGNNQFYLWGPRGYDGSVVIAVNVDVAAWSRMCKSTRVAARFGASPYVMPYEHDRPIVLCRGMNPPLPQVWPSLKDFGIMNLHTP